MEYFNVGKIVNTQGLQGELRVLSVSDFTEERFQKGNLLALFDEKDQFVKDVEIVNHRIQKNFDIVKFKDMNHINVVEKFKGYTLKISEYKLTDLDEDEFYYHEIIGLDVYEDDVLIGTVKEILQPGATLSSLTCWAALPGRRSLRCWATSLAAFPLCRSTLSC